MKNLLTTYKERPDKKNPTRNPWFLESVQNGLKATNIREQSLTPNRSVPPQYFENDRLFGTGAFESPLKVTDFVKELNEITPRTKGLIFDGHHYLYVNGGILRIRHSDQKEAFFSDETLVNQNVACYLSYLVESTEESQIKTMITEIDNAIEPADKARARISHQDTE
jgi:hypothetical protein